MDVDMAAEIVAAGGKWLDAHAPAGWYNLIDLSVLDVASGSRCVLAQVFKEQAERDPIMWGHNRVGAYTWASERLLPSRQMHYELGFAHLYDGDNPEDFSWGIIALNEAWKQYVNARRIAEQEPWIQGQLVNDLAASLGQMARGEGVPARTLAEEMAAA